VELAVTIVIGMGVGVMVELLLPGHTPIELVLVVLLGVVGSLAVHLTGQWFGWFGPGEAVTFVCSLLGAFLVILIYGLLFRKLHR
jgi:uncharacterized membrane protein YeaQ/YmgE (transglycosylase-associated protein family)